MVNGNSLSILNFENQFLPVDVKQKSMKCIYEETPHKSKEREKNTEGEENYFPSLKKESYFQRNRKERCDLKFLFSLSGNFAKGKLEVAC